MFTQNPPNVCILNMNFVFLEHKDLMGAHKVVSSYDKLIYTFSHNYLVSNKSLEK